MIIQIDTREQKSGHVETYLDAQGIRYIRSKLFVGDFTRLDNQTVCVDRKQNLQEVAGNLCQQHERFRAECVRAQEAGITLVVLIEHGGAIDRIDAVRNWVNPRLQSSPYAITGPRMAAIMERMTEKYGVDWQFCRKKDTGKRIVEILGAEK